MSQNSILVHIKRKKEGEFRSLLEQLIFITNECDVIYYNWWNKNIHFFFLSHEIKVKRKALSSATSNFLFNFFFLSQSYGKRICPNCSHGKLNLSLVVCGMWIYWLMETVRPTVYVYLLKKKISLHFQPNSTLIYLCSILVLPHWAWSRRIMWVSIPISFFFSFPICFSSEYTF